jgi:hypothetical protein
LFLTTFHPLRKPCGGSQQKKGLFTHRLITGLQAFPAFASAENAERRFFSGFFGSLENAVGP